MSDKLTKKDFILRFGDELDLNMNRLNQYIARENLIYENRKIDLKHPANQAFIEHRREKINSSDALLEPMDEDLTINDLNKRKKMYEIQKIKRESELKLIDIQKKQGDLIPTELVFNIISLFVQGILRRLEGDLDNITRIYVSRLQPNNRTVISLLKTDVSEKIQENITEMKEVLLNDIEELVKEYSQTRERGERGK